MNCEHFGKEVWRKLCEKPMGSRSKRELELSLLGEAVDSGLLKPRADHVAASLNIPITRAHGYLTDLALRKPPLTDSEGVKQLIELLNESEIDNNESYISMPLLNAAVRIWLERKMVFLRLNAGDSLRRDHVKLTPAGLAKVIDSCPSVATPYDAIQHLRPELQDADWAKSANQHWREGTKWSEAVSTFANVATIVQVFTSLLGF